ncbi:MAG: VWA domain-containing protein [Candidatus Poribacteria bacterium]|nr:VWA domain-containing protein [Candidatus Poribacteria bacterium]
MLKRRSASPYFIFSLCVHCVLLSVMWWMIPKQDSLLPFRDEIEVSITHVERPPLPVKILPVIEPATPVVVKETKPPPPPKPKAGLNAAWQTENQSVADLPKSEVRRQEGLNRARDSIGTVVGRPADYTTGNRIAVSSPNQPMVAPLTPETDYVAPQGETKPIDLGANDALSSGSPTVNAPKIHYGSRRGDALRATGVGNSWGGGGGTGGGNVGGVFVYMMKDIARTLAEASTTKKVDVVFVLDETASMDDNIRGIRAYVDFVSEALEREGRSPSFGLVTFTDKTRNFGQTDDLGTFKNRLSKTGVDGGGDLAEAGLDALMAVVTEMKFRKGAQRFVVLASDAAFHDADYNGRSVYSLDQVIEALQNEQIRVDVIGLDYLPIRQIALATGGTWRAIPGRGYLEYVPPLTLTVKLFSKLGTLRLESGQIDDKITVYINNPPRPKQLTMTWKVLNPLGERVYGPFSEMKIIPDDGSTQIELTPAIDAEYFRTMPGIYTIIYRLENEHGHQSILRRTLTF